MEMFMKPRFALAFASVALLSLPALAQTSTAPTNNHPSTSAQSSQQNTKPPLYQMKPGEWRATKLTGLNVYDSQNNKIGDINELLIGQDGKIEAVVVGIGGFLGMGEHNVAIPMNEVKWVDEPVNNNRASGSSTPPAGTATNSTMRNDNSANRTAANDTGTRNKEEHRPDHAMVNMTKDQLKQLPEVRYDNNNNNKG
jgi:sporulation protein YlmC with PRC-barrel domain